MTELVNLGGAELESQLLLIFLCSIATVCHTKSGGVESQNLLFQGVRNLKIANRNVSSGMKHKCCLPLKQLCQEFRLIKPLTSMESHLLL